MLRLDVVALANVQNKPGDADVYVGKVKALNPVLVIVYRPAELVAGNSILGVGIVSEVPDTVVMFVRHSVGPRMRKLAFGATWILPAVSTVRSPADVTPADGVAS